MHTKTIEKRRGASPQSTCRAESNPGPEKPKSVTSKSVTWRCLVLVGCTPRRSCNSHVLRRFSNIGGSLRGVWLRGAWIRLKFRKQSESRDSEGGNSENRDSEGRDSKGKENPYWNSPQDRDSKARDSEVRDSGNKGSESRDSEARDSENVQIHGPLNSDTP